MKFEFAHKQVDCGSCACSNKNERVGFISVARLFYDGATFLTRLDCETTWGTVHGVRVSIQRHDCLLDVVFDECQGFAGGGIIAVNLGLFAVCCVQNCAVTWANYRFPYVRKQLVFVFLQVAQANLVFLCLLELNKFLIFGLQLLLKSFDVLL